MKIKKFYRCGICGEFEFQNIFDSISFKCPKCETEFSRNDIGIMIGKTPSEDWKNRNIDIWNEIKEINCPPNYIEIFPS